MGKGAGGHVASALTVNRELSCPPPNAAPGGGVHGSGERFYAVLAEQLVAG